MERINIRGVGFDNVNMEEALTLCEGFINEGGNHTIHTPNAEIVQMCVEEASKRGLINSADLIIPDGAGVILAGKILGTKLEKGKVAGIELCENLVRLSGPKGWKIFMLGGKLGVADAAATKLTEKYPDASIVGINDGYFKNDAEVIEKINASGADILFVCLGVPKQEEWMYAHKNELNVKLMGGFGGSFDVFAGQVNRAPDFFIKCNLEWFYRLMKEPSRIGRMMKLPKFVFGSIKDKIIRKKY
ncbi:MAG: WecB/TagA/CpsF family glycosyltransferase [Clostridia bacterium]|nr:WecB/TagA/CpsF family glycosyltransferase [Clostridia bacterium]